ncbi:MAG: hypothetical protein SVX43_13325, partial [Cyanobacteriota bacterium]|nr:hypothetical protein [Cyanobacteriota bacterium]
VREGIAIHTPARDNTLQITFQHPVHRRLESLALRKARKVASILKIPQKVRGKDFALQTLRLNIKRALKLRPDEACEAILRVA